MRILTTKEVQAKYPHKRKRVASFSSRLLGCEECLKLFDPNSDGFGYRRIFVGRYSLRGRGKRRGKSRDG